MILAAMLLQAAAPAPTPPPSAEALEWGMRVARRGTFAQLAPMLAAQEIDALVKDHQDLSPADQAELRRTAEATAAAVRERGIAIIGQGYARELALDELRTVATFLETPAAARWRAAELVAIRTTSVALGSVDLKRDALAAFCARTGKGCEAGN